MSNKRKLIMPSPAEDTAINAGIAADPDTYELSQAEFKKLQGFFKEKTNGSTLSIAEVNDAIAKAGAKAAEGEK